MLPTVPYAKTVYLDNASTTPTDPAILDLMVPYFGNEYGNPSSLHSSGRKAGQVINEARQMVASVLKAQPQEIIFTGSGTEADNLAILGIARANRRHGNHVIISAIEHKAILESARLLQSEGFVISVVPVDSEGLIDVDTVVSLIRSETILISVMYANNEVGTIEPIKELTRAVKVSCHDHPFPLVHTDACQAAGYLSLAVDELGVDALTINSAKIYGPKGVGALYVRQGVAIEPIVVGGSQELHKRAGTESVPLIRGFAQALSWAEERRNSEANRLTSLRDYFIKRLQSEIPQVVVNGHVTKRLPNNVHVSIPHIEGESLLLMLDHYGIEVGTGSACSALDLKPSYVLLALGQRLELVHGSLRFSMGKDTTPDDIEYVMSVLPDIVARLTNISALATKFIQTSPQIN